MTRNAASYPCMLLATLLAFVQPAQAQDSFGVRGEYLEAAFDEMETKYDTIENYFCKALGIDATGQKALRDLYLAHE